ncbi:polysaccharide biosynthesis/export family protein [Rhizobium halophytocola]|uniref:Polysaccharide export outer membrane protein n=1 Tax=Rhizobium halophytocola TaxID=735519 RepID=A0ABS4E6B7_9HYPH|nr:polysaccharide biosynthesis/export family protein [Rhizobium halophytocola]MBP1853457.1 polysaccharide export outer membrane protein [Rhizobium halophytocola]
MRRLAPLLLVALAAAGCRPADGPSNGSIQSAHLPGGGQKIPVIELADAPSGAASAFAPTPSDLGAGLSALGGGAYNSERLRPGDVIDVTVLDTGEDGLFASTNSKTLNLGRFTVDQKGFVSMPFVGRQRVAESTPTGLERQIVSGLKGTSVNPQAVVTIVDKPSSAVIVSGAVNAPGKIPLTAKHEKVMDAIAQAGGASGKPDAVDVTIVRGKRRATASLSRVMNEDRQNIYLQPDDQVMVEGGASTFTALGAFKSAGEIQFEVGKLSLAQAVGRAGGLLDDRADAGNVYVFRNQYIKVPVPAAVNDKTPTATTLQMRPVIYHVNMRKASSIALMQLFQMQKDDVLYATNAPLVDYAKLFTIYQKSAPTAAAPAPSL